MSPLFIVATPIGNLEDITLRALRVLKEVDLIAAEDTRHTRKLLTHYGIATRLISYHAHNQKTRGPELIERIKSGQNIAMVCDAGTPGFSDPGADLAALAWDAGVRVEAVPGPAAGVAALSMSGFPGDVTFVGFLPSRGGRRRELLGRLAKENRAVIIYESPRRLLAALEEIAAVMGNRRVLVVRELTKKFEEAWRGPVAVVLEELRDREIKGECVLVLSCPEGEPDPEVDVAGELLKKARAGGLQGRRLTDSVAAELKAPRRLVYQAYLALKAEGKIK
jgi:16S rRNA (cytidine1402-2'-O)-methyltransferase